MVIHETGYGLKCRLRHVAVELGAEFLHGAENNVLLDWIKTKGVKGRPNAGTMVT